MSQALEVHKCTQITLIMDSRTLYIQNPGEDKPINVAVPVKDVRERNGIIRMGILRDCVRFYINSIDKRTRPRNEQERMIHQIGSWIERLSPGIAILQVQNWTLKICTNSRIFGLSDIDSAYYCHVSFVDSDHIDMSCIFKFENFNMMSFFICSMAHTSPGRDPDSVIRMMWVKFKIISAIYYHISVISPKYYYVDEIKFNEYHSVLGFHVNLNSMEECCSAGFSIEYPFLTAFPVYAPRLTNVFKVINYKKDISQYFQQPGSGELSDDLDHANMTFLENEFIAITQASGYFWNLAMTLGREGGSDDIQRSINFFDEDKVRDFSSDIPNLLKNLIIDDVPESIITGNIIGIFFLAYTLLKCGFDTPIRIIKHWYEIETQHMRASRPDKSEKDGYISPDHQSPNEFILSMLESYHTSFACGHVSLDWDSSL
jgi:hypothetical protein